jgi:hypothetical protein
MPAIPVQFSYSSTATLPVPSIFITPHSEKALQFITGPHQQIREILEKLIVGDFLRLVLIEPNPPPRVDSEEKWVDLGCFRNDLCAFVFVTYPRLWEG